MTFEISTPLTVTYSVDKCALESLNGTHTETFDLSKLTSDDIEQYLAQTLIIKRQAQLRAKSNLDADKEIKVGNWIVTAPGKRISTSPMEKAASLIGKLTDEQRRALLAMLEAGE